MKRDNIEAKRKDCLKQYNALQDLMKKVIDLRGEITEEAEKCKREKIIVNMNKVESLIFKHKNIVKCSFETRKVS
jgi:hypothetical protein